MNFLQSLLRYAVLFLLHPTVVLGQDCSSYPVDEVVSVTDCIQLQLVVQCSVERIVVASSIECAAEVLIADKTGVIISGDNPEITSTGANRLFSITNSTATFVGLRMTGGGSRLLGAGGIMSAMASTLIMKGCTVSNGLADTGGAIFADLSAVSLIDSSFTSNTAFRVGGFLYAPVNLFLNITNCDINYNLAYVDGGGVAIIGGTVHITDSSFENNYASNRGGSMVLYDVTADVRGTAVLHSQTQKSTAFRGGSIFATSSDLLFDSLLCQNSTGSDGYFMYLSTCVTTILHSDFIDGSGISGIVVKSKGSVFDMVDSHVSRSTGSSVAAVSCDAGTKCRISDCSFSDNNSTAGSVVDLEAVAASYIKNCTFSRNHIEASGCLSLRGVVGFEISDSLFHFNYARKSGGGLYTTGSEAIVVSDCKFISNAAGTGGAVFTEALSDVSFSSCTFTANKAYDSAGAIFIDDNSVVDVFDSTLTKHYAVYGGALFIGYKSTLTARSLVADDNSAFYNGGFIAVEGSSIVVIQDSDIINNRAQDGAGFDIRIASYVTIKNSNMYGNSARYSGGVVIVSDDGVAVVHSCQIINNTAQFSGAVFSIFSSEIYVRNSTFASNVAGVDGSICASAIGYAYFEGNSIIENKAYRGGCFFLDLSAKLLTIGNMIVNNQAILGAVAFLSTDTQWKAINDTMASNIGSLSGGVCNGDKFLLLSWYTCDISRNEALVGSIASLSKGATVFIEATKFTANNAFAYGGLVLESTSLYLESNTFVSNTAFGRGACISIAGISPQESILFSEDFETTINNCTFEGNIVYETVREAFRYFEGAAIAFNKCEKASVSNCSFIENEALYGGAIFSLESAVNVSGSNFFSNKAKFGGGAIYWIIDEEHEDHSVILSPDCQERKNRAAFGNFAATDTYRLSAGNSTRIETSGQMISESFNVTLLDYYDQIVQYEDISNSNIVYILTNDSDHSSIQGQTLVEAEGGYAVFDKLIITYFPETVLSLRFDMAGVPSLYYPVAFRGCVSGEIYETLSTDNVVCTRCEEGFYSLAARSEVCESCPDNTNCPGGNVLDIEEGYWRVADYSDTVLECPFKHACLGGTDVKEQCEPGHEGKYCDVCEDGYVHSADGTCSACNDGSFIAVAIVIPIVVFLVFVVFVLANIHSDKIKAYVNEKVVILADKAEEYNFSSLRTKVKIMITFIQILSQMPSVFGALFPEGYLSFLDIFGLFNLNIISFLSLGCVIESNFYSQLLTATVGPLILVILVAFALLIKKRATRHSFNPYHMAEFRKDMLTAILMITFFIFSPTSITIFEAFTCESFDDGTNQLVADYSINCDTDVHKNYEIYAGFMIIVYPIGIPIFYFYLLVSNHKYVNPSAALVVREDEKMLVDRRIIQAEKMKLRESYTEIQHLSFLYENYAPKRWYFEVLDCFRRLLLTAIPVLILRGTSLQLLLVLMASLVWCIVYMSLKPFERPNDNTIAIMSQWAISFTLIGGVMLKVTADEQNAQYYVIDVLLIFINVTVILSTVYIAATSEEDDILEELAKDAKRQKQKYGGNEDSDDDSAYKKGRAAETEMKPSRKASVQPSNRASIENPMYRDQAQSRTASSVDKKAAPSRRASALGSQLFATAQMKRGSVLNPEADATESRRSSVMPGAAGSNDNANSDGNDKTPPRKRGSVMDRFRGGNKKSSKKASQTNAAPDSDDDSEAPTDSFSARAGVTVVGETTTSPFGTNHRNRGKGAKNRGSNIDDSDDDF